MDTARVLLEVHGSVFSAFKQNSRMTYHKFSYGTVKNRDMFQNETDMTLIKFLHITSRYTPLIATPFGKIPSQFQTNIILKKCNSNHN